MTVPLDLDAVYTRLFPKLVGALSLQCGDRVVAEDLAQEALSRYWERSGSMEIESPDAWTFRVAFNLANSWLRRRAAERRAYSRRDQPPVAAHEEPADAIAIRDALWSLPARQREVVILRFYADLPVEETAAAMRCAPGTVKAQTHRALTALGRLGFVADGPDD
jgi:RNA polymerase sigma factor (sigma-70 family)